MALVANGFTLTVQFQDAAEDKTARTYEMAATTPAQAQTDAVTAVAAIAGVSEAGIVGYTIGARYVEDAYVAPAAAVEVENTAEVLLNITGSPVKKAPTNIPAPRPAIFVGVTGPNKNVINTGHAAVVAFADQFNPGGANTLRISDGETANGVSKGRRIHKKSRKG